ncbi:hypothetical protein K3V87_14785, partial [Listeria monocytogenes]|nr:hypothetical protein [Listeria monocytogenes]
MKGWLRRVLRAWQRRQAQSCEFGCVEIKFFLTFRPKGMADRLDSHTTTSLSLEMSDPAVATSALPTEPGI